MAKERRPQRALVSGALFIAVLLGLWVVSAPRGGGLGKPVSAQRTAEGALSMEAPQEIGEVRRGEPRVPLESHARPAAEEESAEEDNVSGRGHLVRGTLTLTDCFDQVLTSLDGHVTALTREEGERRSIQVEIRKGEFEFLLADPSHLFVHDLVIEGRDATLEWSPETRSLLGASTLQLKAREQCELRLEVRDSVTGAELDGIEVWIDDMNDQSMVAPYIAEVIAKDVASPFTLPKVDLDWGSERAYWVRAEGYGWGKAFVDHRRTGDYLVELGPGADLTVEVLGAGDFRGHSPCLSLWRIEDGQVVAEWTEDPPFTHTWEGLPLGSYRVSYSLDCYSSDAPSLGSAEVTLRGGDEAAIAIEAMLPDFPFGPVTVRGTVRAKKFWRDRSFRLKFSPLAETRRWASSHPTLYLRDLVPDGADPDLLRWSTELPCEGSWQVAVAPFRVNRDFTASALATEEIELSLGEPAELAILVKDAMTGEILPSIGITYEYVGSPQNRAMMYLKQDYNPISSRHQLAIPAGHVVLKISAQAHQSAEEELHLNPGVHELSFELEPVGGVNFSFYDGVSACPLNLLEVEIEATPEGGVGDIYEVWIHTLTFSEPGTYLVRFTQLPGYLPIETTVKVPSIGRVPHEVHLMRE